MPDRKRIFAWFAQRGLPQMGAMGAHVHPSSRSILYRLRLLVLLSAWTTWCCLTAASHRSWAVLLNVFKPRGLDDL